MTPKLSPVETGRRINPAVPISKKTQTDLNLFIYEHDTDVKGYRRGARNGISPAPGQGGLV